MRKKTRILIIGLGSIGRRHLSFLSLFDHVIVAAYRTNKGEITETSHIKEFYTIEGALEFKPDGVIVSNPTSLHVEYALPFLDLGVKVLIEKPIGSELSQVMKLEKYQSIFRVAYCMRFSELALKLTEIFKSDFPFKVTFRRSFFLPKWHPYANYSKEYTARKELGGGVIRTLSHELDLSIFWFKEPISLNGVTDKISFLDIDTDDFAFYTMKAESGLRINFELDFFSPINKNEGEAFTAKGHYFWNTKELYFTPYESSIPQLHYKFSDDSLDLMYKSQIEDFLNFVENGNSKNSTFKEALCVMKIINNVELQS